MKVARDKRSHGVVIEIGRWRIRLLIGRFQFGKRILDWGSGSAGFGIGMASWTRRHRIARF